MHWFRDRRADRVLRQEQRMTATFRTGRFGRSSRSRSRSRPRSQPLSSKERMDELENEDLEGAVLDLEDNADQWSDWWDEWKIFLNRLWSRLRYLQ